MAADVTAVPVVKRIRRTVAAYRPFWIGGAMVAALFLAGVALLWAATTSVPKLSSRGQISAIELGWWPPTPGPGPAPRVYTTGPVFQSAVAVVPVPLPRRRFDPLTRCHIGVEVTLRLSNGNSVTYGPCKRPASIDRVFSLVESG